MGKHRVRIETIDAGEDRTEIRADFEVDSQVAGDMLMAKIKREEQRRRVHEYMAEQEAAYKKRLDAAERSDAAKEPSK